MLQNLMNDPEMKATPIENIQVLEKHFKKVMIGNDFERFKRTHPTLLRVILAAMDEVKAPGNL